MWKNAQIMWKNVKIMWKSGQIMWWFCKNVNHFLTRWKYLESICVINLKL